jgi:replicative DNA helicase
VTSDVSVAGLSNGAHARTLPHDTNAEQSVLGALFIDQEAISVVRDILEPADFYAEKHQHIYRAAATLHDKGEPIDVVTVRAQLEKDGSVSRAGGVDYLAELTLAVPTAVSAKHYAEIVVNNALRRRLIAAGTSVAAMGYDNTMTAEDAIDQAEQKIFGVAEQQRTDEAVHLAPIVKETWDILEERLKSRKLVHGVPTNFAPLDAVTQGLQPGELVILAARPSVGKTSFALNIARNASLLARRPVAVFSLEMTKQSLVQRLICSEAAVDSHLLSTGQADASAFQRIAKAMDALIETPLWIDDTPALSISTLRARARRMVAQYNIELVVVDYLQLMRGGRQESRVQEVSDISSGLKSIAKELRIPVLALSQLSRESERRENRQPQLSDLRDSGSIEQDADVVLFLYRPGMHKDEVDKSVTELLVAKNRNGPTTKIDLHFVANQTTFRDVFRGSAPHDEES